jgi:hypothetical protein
MSTADRPVTLLDNLCFVAGVQGGVIHQYCDVMEENYTKFRSMWQELYNMNGMITTKEGFVKIAARANYEGLIWRSRKMDERKVASLTPEARDSYFKSRGL